MNESPYYIKRLSQLESGLPDKKYRLQILMREFFDGVAFINRYNFCMMCQIVDQEENVIRNIIFVLNLKSKKLFRVPVELDTCRDEASSLSNILQEDVGSVHLCDETVLYHQSYSCPGFTPPYKSDSCLKGKYTFLTFKLKFKLKEIRCKMIKIIYDNIIYLATFDFEEVYLVRPECSVFELVCRSSNPLAVVGHHIYHCDDPYNDSDDSAFGYEI